MNPRAVGEHPVVPAVGAAIARRRRALRMRQVDLAARCDVDRVFISYVENGHRNPTLVTLAQLADALDVKLSDLLADAGH